MESRQAYALTQTLKHLRNSIWELKYPAQALVDAFPEDTPDEAYYEGQSDVLETVLHLVDAAQGAVRRITESSPTES